jgi:chemotaxis protein CheZ
MAETAQLPNDRLTLARSLVSHLETGNDNDAGSVIAELAGFTDSLLFQEVGRLTRELHDSINGFVMDSRLVDIAEHEMPDAAERLRYVITTTEQAANTTLGAVEDSLPLADSLRSDAHHLSEQWARFNSRQMSVDDFRELSSELSQFLEATQANSEELHNKLSEVLMAQGYQDLTGQVIRKVIDLVNDVEHKLVELVRLSGHHALQDKKAVESGPEESTGHGPTVPGVDKGDRVSNQDDVDDLLSSLGF